MTNPEKLISEPIYPRDRLFTVDHEQGLLLKDPRVMHDGPEHRIVRLFAEAEQRQYRTAELTASVYPCRGGPAAVVVADNRAGTRLQVKVRVPQRLHDEHGSYFAAVSVEGREVTVIVAAMDWERHGGDRPLREGDIITGEVSHA